MFDAQPAGRTPEQVKVDLLAAHTRVAQLEIELAEAKDARRAAVIKAFDDGASRAQLVTAFGITYDAVTGILQKAGRSEKQRQALGLTPAQEATYRRLTRQGVPSKSARQIALLGTPASQAERIRV